MTDLVTCPSCRDQLDVPTEFRGRSVKCATCQTVFPVPAEPEPPSVRPSRAGARTRPRDPDDFDDTPKRRGNGLVWFLLLGTLLVCGGISLACAGFSVWLYNPPMKAHTSDDGKFTVEFPGDPAPFQQTGEKGVVMKGMEARRQTNEMRFSVKYYDLPKAPQDDEQAVAEAIKSEIASLAAGSELQRQTTRHAGFPALDVQLSQGPEFLRRITILRVVLVGKRVYILMAQGQNLMPEIAYVQKFFISFLPAEKAKPPMKPVDE